MRRGQPWLPLVKAIWPGVDAAPAITNNRAAERVAQSFTKMAAYSDGVDEARTAIHREKERRARGVPAK